MAKLPSAGVLSAEDLKAHFGSSSNSLSQYYEGGEVPNNSINDPIPNSSGEPNNGNNFYGASNENALSASISPSSVSGSGPFGSSGSTYKTTEEAACSASGGGGNAFSWARISGDTELAADSPGSQTTFFSLANAPSPAKATYSATFRCTVTSDDGQTASDTVDVSISVI